MNDDKIYLSDGAYVEFTGYDFVLTTSDGLSDTNRIHLDGIALKRLIEFYKHKVKGGVE